jgi:hypothetical protein
VSDRDWLMTSDKDLRLLDDAKYADDSGQGTMRPVRGDYARARRLAKRGLLKKAGISAMPPHVVYVLTDLGFEELTVANKLKGATP